MQHIDLINLILQLQSCSMTSFQTRKVFPLRVYRLFT
jgi:hypothetical protein